MWSVFVIVCLLLVADDCVVFMDLSTDVTLFEGSGDYQFDIYRLMRNSNKSAILVFLLNCCQFWLCWSRWITDFSVVNYSSWVYSE